MATNGYSSHRQRLMLLRLLLLFTVQHSIDGQQPVEYKTESNGRVQQPLDNTIKALERIKLSQKYMESGTVCSDIVSAVEYQLQQLKEDIATQIDEIKREFTSELKNYNNQTVELLKQELLKQDLLKELTKLVLALQTDTGAVKQDIADMKGKLPCLTTATTGNESNSGPLKPSDCADIMTLGSTASGIYTVYVGSMKRPVSVYCDMTTDGGGWTVFQRRQDGSENFYRNWTDYATGFGNLSREFWLGNDNLHLLTSARRNKLRIDLADFNGNERYAEYDDFLIASASNKYQFQSLGTYSGTAGHSLSTAVGFSFSTFDQDNDDYHGNCAVLFKGAWWYSNCHQSNLNGYYYGGPHTSYADGIEWYYWTGHYYSLKFTEMKLRPA